MTPKEHFYQKEYAAELVRIARGDLESGQALAELRKGRPENICYLAQQCVEKCLKALLCFKEKPIVHTHSIELLLFALGRDYNVPNSENLLTLTDYAMVRRYEEGAELITDKDIETILSLAQEVCDWAEKIVNP